MKTQTSTHQTETNPLFALSEDKDTHLHAACIAVELGLEVQEYDLSAGYGLAIMPRPATVEEMLKREAWIKIVAECELHGITIAEAV